MFLYLLSIYLLSIYLFIYADADKMNVAYLCFA